MYTRLIIVNSILSSNVQDYGYSATVAHTGGRSLVLKLNNYDILHLGTERMDNDFYRILACYEVVTIWNQEL